MRPSCVVILAFLVACSSDTAPPSGAMVTTTTCPTPPPCPACEVQACPSCPNREPEVADLRRRLAEAEGKLAQLAETSEGRYAELLPRLSTEDDVDMAYVDAVLDEIDAFRERFPNATQTKPLLAYKKKFEDARKELIRLEGEAKVKAAAEAVRSKIGTVDDGPDLDVDAAFRAARFIESEGLDFDALSRLPKSNFDEAMKDPEAERGKMLSFSGRIVQIRKDGDIYTGQMCTGYCSKVIYFITPGTTKGLVEDKQATFAGIVTQRYTYANAAGGATHSLLLVGHFKGQK